MCDYCTILKVQYLILSNKLLHTVHHVTSSYRVESEMIRTQKSFSRGLKSSSVETDRAEIFKVLF